MYGTTQLLRIEQDNQLQILDANEWTHEEVREELGRILGSRFFVKSERLSCFLRTAVAYLLDGRGDHFKEYTVGTEVYKRPSSYDPTQDSIVRTEARRLRSKLKEYYSSSPARSSIVILLLAGSYIPVIQSRFGWEHEIAVQQGHLPLVSRSEALSIGVFPFSARSIDSSAQILACNIEDELTHELAQHPRMNVFRAPHSIQPDPTAHLHIWNRSGVQLVLQGYINRSTEGMTVQIQLTTISGMIVWSGRFDCEALSSRYRDISTTVLAAVLSAVAFDPKNSNLVPVFSS